MRQVDRMSGQNHVTGIRARVLEEDREEDHVTLTTLRADLADARARLSDAEAEIAGLQKQIDATDALAFRAEDRSIDALRGVQCCGRAGWGDSDRHRRHSFAPGDRVQGVGHTVHRGVQERDDRHTGGSVSAC